MGWLDGKPKMYLKFKCCLCRPTKTGTSRLLNATPTQTPAIGKLQCREPKKSKGTFLRKADERAAPCSTLSRGVTSRTTAGPDTRTLCSFLKPLLLSAANPLRSVGKTESLGMALLQAGRDSIFLFLFNEKKKKKKNFTWPRSF